MAARFYFRDDLEADKTRQFEADQAAQAQALEPVPPADETAIAPAPAPTIPETQDATAGAANAANAAFSGPAAPKAGPTDYFADFRQTLKDQDPIRAKLQASAEKQIATPGAAFDVGSAAARDRLGREIGAAQEETRQSAATTFGGDRSGQMGRTMGSFRNETLIAQQEQERDLAAGRAEAVRGDIQAGQAGLQAILSSMDSQSRILADFALTQADQAFQEKMQATGYLQTKDLETMRNDLQRELQAKGFDQQTATQIADQQFQKAMQEREQVYGENIEKLRQTFQRGERIDSQDFAKAMQASETAANESLARLSSLLRLNEQENAQIFQTSFQTMQNAFTELRDQKGMDHETAMQAAANTFAKQLQDAGYDHDTAMQAAQLAANAHENQLNRASQELMATTQLAQQDAQFRAELGLKEQELANNGRLLESQLELMGFQGQQIQQAMQNENVRQAMEMAAIGMEMGNGSQEAMAPFAALLGSAMEQWAAEAGFDFDASSFSSGIGAPSETTTGTEGGPTPASQDAIDEAYSYLDQVLSNIPGGANIDQTELEGNIKDYATGQNIDSNNVYNRIGSLPGAEDAGITKTGTSGSGRSAGGVSFGKPTQEGYDYYGYHRLQQLGIPEKEAWEIMSRAVGADRMNAAYEMLRQQPRAQGGVALAGGLVGAATGGG